MNVAWSGRIGSRGDVMGLCDGACDFRSCIVQIEEKLREKIVQKMLGYLH